jgi:hypothetical protein
MPWSSRPIEANAAAREASTFCGPLARAHRGFMGVCCSLPASRNRQRSARRWHVTQRIGGHHYRSGASSNLVGRANPTRPRTISRQRLSEGILRSRWRVLLFAGVLRSDPSRARHGLLRNPGPLLLKDEGGRGRARSSSGRLPRALRHQPPNAHRPRLRSARCWSALAFRVIQRISRELAQN